MADDIKEPHAGGRPPISEKEKDIMVSKLEPYLKTGLSISKACSEAQISRATFYRLMDSDEEFRDKINRFRQFVAVMLNSSLVSHLHSIIGRQSNQELLAKEEIDFLKWFALNSNLTKGEFGERKDINLFDPEAEIQKVKGIVEESSSDQIDHDQ